jgi:predicted nuclease of predicted toxin-antitoxin system
LNWVVDENIDRPIVAALRNLGHIVSYIPERDAGITDDAILDLAAREGALLLTSDKGFGELVFRQGRASAGVVLLRMAGLSADQKAQLVVAAVTAHAPQLQGAFTVVTARAIRVRRSTQ